MASHSPTVRRKMPIDSARVWSEHQTLLLAAAGEASQLYLSACRENEHDASRRLKILSDISGQLMTDTLLMLAHACSEAHHRGELEEELRAYLGGPIRWVEDRSWSGAAADTAKSGPSAEITTGTAVAESLRLFAFNLGANPVETVIRLRALQVLEDGPSVEVLLLILESVTRANAAGVLDDNLRAFLAAKFGLYVWEEKRPDQAH